MNVEPTPESPTIPVPAPSEVPMELDRMRRAVHSELFGTAPEPTRIGRFRLLECIGRGGMGVVWSAHDEELDRTVAIKLLRPELSGHDLAGEARALAKLSHPNVVSVFDVGAHDGQRFIAMEFVRGTTLRSWLARSREWPEVVSMFVDAGKGLAAAHEVGLVHRDFKPDNVLVGLDARPRVLDFGLARAPDQGSGGPSAIPAGTDPFATTVTVGGLLIGTPAYMAPEQHLGDPADARSDQFAFAVALYEGLAGQLPFSGEDLRTLSLAVVRGRLDPPPEWTIPAPVLEVLCRALASDPAKRYETMDAMIEALTACVAKGASPEFDTQAVDRVLARAAELQGQSSGRPGLTVPEIAEVAAEAGIDSRHAIRAAGEALAKPQPPRPAALPVPAATSGRRRKFNILDSVTPEITVTRDCARLDQTGVGHLIRELERRHGAGETEYLGASTAWQSKKRKIELHVDPAPGGSQLTLRQETSPAERGRLWAFGGIGWLIGVGTGAPLAETLIPRTYEGVMVFCIFASMILGALAGRAFGLVMHARSLERQRRQLRGVADRLAAIAASNAA